MAEMTTTDIRQLFIDKYNNNQFIDTRFGKSIEVINAHFIYDDLILPDAPSMDIYPRWYQDNYDPLIYHDQFNMCIHKLVSDKNTRQAELIFVRHEDAIKENPICTNYVQMFIRYDTLIYIVNMRSSDIVESQDDIKYHKDIYHNIYNKLTSVYEYKLNRCPIYWNAGSLHIYEKDFKYLLKS